MSGIIGKLKKQPIAEAEKTVALGSGINPVTVKVDSLHYVNAVLEVEYTSESAGTTVYKERGVHVSGNSVGMTVETAGATTLGLKVYAIE